MIYGGGPSDLHPPNEDSPLCGLVTKAVDTRQPLLETISPTSLEATRSLPLKE